MITKPNIDGFLVGGASLKPSFMDIVSKVVGDQPICKHRKPGKQKAYDKSMWLKEMMIYNMTCKVVMVAILNCQMKMAMNYES